MIFGSTKTKLDYIIELGFSRIDAAIDDVCDQYKAPTIDPIEIESQAILAESASKGSLVSGKTALLMQDLARHQATNQLNLLLGDSGLSGLGAAAQGNRYNQFNPFT